MLTKYRLLLLMGVVTACLGCGDTQRPSAPPIPEPNQTKPLESLGQREGLPTDLKCQDDYHPTLWEGRVIEFKRDNKKTEIEIKADWDAHYKGWLHNSEAGNPPLNLFRINGEPFKPTDWNIV